MSLECITRTSLFTVMACVLGFAPVRAADWDVRSFAQCIADSGARYYGAHWCPHCRRQNALFGADARYLPYIECAAAGSRRQLPHCKHISGYPTWLFASGKERHTVLSFDELATYTGCQLKEKDYFVD